MKIKVDCNGSLPIEKRLALHHVVIILIKPVLDKNKKSLQIFLLRFGEREITNDKFYAPKSLVKIWDFNVDNIVLSKLVNLVKIS